MSQSAAPWQEGCTANSIIAKIFHRARNVLLPCWWKHEHTSGPQQLRQRPQITGPKISLVLLVLWQHSPPGSLNFRLRRGEFLQAVWTGRIQTLRVQASQVQICMLQQQFWINHWLLLNTVWLLFFYSTGEYSPILTNVYLELKSKYHSVKRHFVGDVDVF